MKAKTQAELVKLAKLMMQVILDDAMGPRQGRPAGVTDYVAKKQTVKIIDLWNSGRFKSQSELAKHLGVNRSSVCRALKIGPSACRYCRSKTTANGKQLLACPHGGCR